MLVHVPLLLLSKLPDTIIPMKFLQQTKKPAIVLISRDNRVNKILGLIQGQWEQAWNHDQTCLCIPILQVHPQVQDLLRNVKNR